jgi:hypothetical protein
MRVANMLNQAKVKNDLIGFVSVNGTAHHTAQLLGDLHQLKEIAAIYKVDEIIFCAKDISSQKIIEWMTLIGPDREYKIVPEDSMSIIGSSSKDSQGELYTINVRLAITTPFNKRNKRLFDLIAGVFLIITLPLNIFFIKNPPHLIQNIFLVLAGIKTWVGYAGNELQQHQLPAIKKGVISPLDELIKFKNSANNTSLNDTTISRINLLYAKDYSTTKDAELFIKCFRWLGT